MGARAGERKASAEGHRQLAYDPSTSPAFVERPQRATTGRTCCRMSVALAAVTSAVLNTAQTRNGHRVRAPSALAAVSCAVVIAACGSSSMSSTTIGSVDTGQGIAFADCMRSHGVTGFPDPSPDGGVALPSTINPQSPSYEAAQQACAKLQNLGQSAGPPSPRST